VIVFFGNSLGVLLSSMFTNIRAAFAVVPVNKKINELSEK
jgi:hypothetical protein